jgi:DNA excision repair protein ERCC-4
MGGPTLMTTDAKKANNYTLPALRTLSGLADQEPVIVVDTREQDPLVFDHLRAMSGTLATGDYSVAGMEELFAVERKTVADLVGCCMGDSRERFAREMHRLRGFRFKRLLIVGTRGEIELQRYHSRIAPKAVLATLSAFEVRYDCPVVFASTPVEAALLVERWVYYFSREIVQLVNGLHRASVQPH